MPTLSSMRILPPTGWNEFEMVTQSALKIKWDSPNLQRNGRQGQFQAGVDVYGNDELGRFAGVQCKNTEADLSLKVITDEVKKAESFQPSLAVYYVATTAPNDAELQKQIRLLSIDRLKDGLFPVGILFWEDLIEELIKNPLEFGKHYPQIRLNTSMPQISGPQLLCNLDIAYHGLQFREYTDLIFGEIGLLANENPLQIRTIGEIVKNCSCILFLQEKARSICEMADAIVELALKSCPVEEESIQRWQDVHDKITSLTQDITSHEYALNGDRLAAYRLGVLLAGWNIESDSPHKLNSDDIEEIVMCFKALGATAEILEKVSERVCEYNDSNSLVKIHTPGKIHRYARRLILKREIEAQQ